jgi:hypothetical protein
MQDREVEWTVEEADATLDAMWNTLAALRPDELEKPRALALAKAYVRFADIAGDLIVHIDYRAADRVLLAHCANDEEQGR